MTIIQQQLRNSSASVQPGDLEPGQLAYNLADSLGYIGNGGDDKIDVEGSTVLPAPAAGKGWLEFPLKVSTIAAGLSFVPDPSGLTPPAAVPIDGQMLAWDSTANGGTGAYVPTTPGGIAVYTIANYDPSIGTSGTTTTDLNAGLIATTPITGPGDLISGDKCVVTDSTNPPTSASVPAGSYIWTGAEWLLEFLY